MPEFPETSHSLIARVKDLRDGAAWTELFDDPREVEYLLDQGILTRISDPSRLLEDVRSECDHAASELADWQVAQ